ncbi:MAG: ABC transporter permease [Deltaproteobacteria bacterium]|nr:MAG: ABC transporter permease [Deltaproteobacteria bacterium]
MTTLKSFYNEKEPYILGIGFIALLILIWESTPLWLTLPRGMALFFTTPSKIAGAFYRLLINGEIEKHSYVSAVAFLVGLGLSILVGLPLGLVMGRSRTLDALLDPYVTALNATPRIVWLPLLILWFGIGIWSKIVIVFAGAVFPMLINTYVGVKNVDRVLVNVVRSFGANEWQVMKVVVLPNSLPYIIAGLRLAIGRAILGVVVGEFFGSSKGLGYMIASAATNYKVDVVFVGVAIFMGFSLILTMSVKSLESRLATWRPEATKTF